MRKLLFNLKIIFNFQNKMKKSIFLKLFIINFNYKWNNSKLNLISHKNYSFYINKLKYLNKIYSFF
jgi:hypothetical protein